MLNNYQIQYLANISNLKVHWLDDTTPLAISGKNTSNILAYPYDNFKVGMGLDDIRFHWLLGENNFIAGGSVLNWVWQENKQGDVDFFFQNSESSDNFILFLKSIGMIEAKQTSYARTLFDSESGAIIQAVGRPEDESFSYNTLFNHNGYKSHKVVRKNFNGYGAPHKILKDFDISVCQFAVDVNNVYFTQDAIIDLISLTLNTTDNIKEHTAIYRIIKYINKGFYPSTKVTSGLNYEHLLF